MQRKRSSVYYAGPSVLHPRNSQTTNCNDPDNPDPHLGVFGKFSDKTFFSDLRVEIDRELVSKHATHPGYLRSKASIVQSSGPPNVITRAKPAATNSNETALVASSNTSQTSRRCQSASAVRKKLFRAVEQGTNNGYPPNHKLQAQIDALRKLTSASFSKSFTKSSNGYRAPNTDSCHGTTSLGRKNSGVMITTCKTKNQDECIAGVGIGPSRSASASILMSNPPQPAAISNTPYQAPSVLVGGYRSSSVQLEVELVERLNEIGRSNLPEKTLSRTRACQNVLDSVVLQDEHYGRLLSRIRDEFSTYVDMTCRKSPTKSNNKKGAKPWCTCGHDVFEFALLKQENSVMKKRVSSMQHEIEKLKAALRQARTGEFTGRNNESVRGTSSTGSEPEDDEHLQEGDLDNVQLFPGDVKEEHFRPQEVPVLSFASLPPYSDEEEDEEGYSQ